MTHLLLNQLSGLKTEQKRRSTISAFYFQAYPETIPPSCVIAGGGAWTGASRRSELGKGLLGGNSRVTYDLAGQQIAAGNGCSCELGDGCGKRLGRE